MAKNQIRLTRDRRLYLRAFARQTVYEKFKKTKFAKELLRVRTQTGKRVFTWLNEEFTPEEHAALQSVQAKIHTWRSWNPFESQEGIGVDVILMGAKTLRPAAKSFLRRWGRGRRYPRDELSTLPFPEPCPFVLDGPNDRYKNVPESIDFDVQIYAAMIYDAFCFMQLELCPYELLIEKKTTLNALSKVWPQAMKFKDEWSQEAEAEPVQTSC